MQLKIFNYKNALEIIEHANYIDVFNEIREILTDCPVFLFKGKSAKNDQLDISQIIMNRYFDYQFSTIRDWHYHPDVIPESGLQADFRKEQNGKQFQIEIQFGNMSRWYSDVFKFQLANIHNLTDIGICVVPMQSMALRIDSNVTNFERCSRELPEISHLMHLPILLIGLDFTEDDTMNLWDLDFVLTKLHQGKISRFVDLSNDERLDLLNTYKDIKSLEKARNIIHGVVNNIPLSDVNSDSGRIDFPKRNIQ